MLGEEHELGTSQLLPPAVLMWIFKTTPCFASFPGVRIPRESSLGPAVLAQLWEVNRTGPLTVLLLISLLKKMVLQIHL